MIGKEIIIKMLEVIWQTFQANNSIFQYLGGALLLYAFIYQIYKHAFALVNEKGHIEDIVPLIFKYILCATFISSSSEIAQIVWDLSISLTSGIVKYTHAITKVFERLSFTLVELSDTTNWNMAWLAKKTIIPLVGMITFVSELILLGAKIYVTVKVLMAFLSYALALTIAPVMISLVFFPLLSEIFKKWISVIFSFFFKIFLYIYTLNITYKIIELLVDKALFKEGYEPINFFEWLEVILQMLVIPILFILLLMSVEKFVSSIIAHSPSPDSAGFISAMMRTKAFNYMGLYGRNKNNAGKSGGAIPGKGNMDRGNSPSGGGSPTGGGLSPKNMALATTVAGLVLKGMKTGKDIAENNLDKTGAMKNTPQNDKRNGKDNIKSNKPENDIKSNGQKNSIKSNKPENDIKSNKSKNDLNINNSNKKEEQNDKKKGFFTTPIEDAFKSVGQGLKEPIENTLKSTKTKITDNFSRSDSSKNNKKGK